ncbi:N-acetyl-gamma-glutamyl-phosphate reductase [Sphingobacterium faecium]|jgi:N-acetyl-gamma-glutamyl-phosphate reductase|uniref:N-acetyl-gamma-glutamyl-phosphate reductase n=1 Tax=Sphingobacterium faecium TaxID=34087 RepID=UPI0004E5F93D|nr:N-acetyl-gamma-glutamyl-phosphate reductase [Sphingobacterium faecium]WGQ16451.1 N-acetyl-gamma-glutamyl-phosphate reductase [Sphingobacterium faecium]CDS91744.1 N-acetyl-gamma-glutamyl-phosphate reductase [Sphingobacterium sp. PM2-P1-29]SJN23397.1 N-acetyl-gamma-glutamyl-phosphate reductase [Sphingobacterium faecium PCAi_F2.5]HCU45222.1 N-acetyl-gamma-glutamyl-phosphate reductase [Sphingobacterium sp.]
MIKVGIVGSAGYTGGELLRILIYHPEVEIVFANSASNAGNKIYEVHNDLFGDTELTFSSDFHSNIDVLFLCVGHGDAKKFLDANPVDASVKIIDLSQDFRLKANTSYQGQQFVYGLPELNREVIKSAQYVANPGCFATNIQLALLPLAYKGLLPEQIHINATTGSTGAGQKPGPTTHFSWRNNNLSAYKSFEHQHLQEISESLAQLQDGFLPQSDQTLLERAAAKINFVPQRGDFTRGIFSVIYVDSDLSEEQAYELYETYYEGHSFTHVSRENIDLKQVVNTNKSIIHLEKHGNKLLILNATDNLLKGASGQAVQNMNLMFGLNERMGLNLKSVGF